MRFLLPWGVLFGSDFARGQSFYDVSCQWLRDHPERLGLEFQSNSVGWIILFWSNRLDISEILLMEEILYQL